MTDRIVFLHIPKTAGQTIHAELSRVVGAGKVSPVRVHTEAGPGIGQFPPGYRLYSGHIDWEGLETVPEPRFVFTVLRDPLERIASFYFYLRRQAKTLSTAELSSPTRTGMRKALENGPDEYFFGGDANWQRFVREHYHSPYCAYLVTRKIRGFSDVASLPVRELADRAEAAARRLDGVYTVEALHRLEDDMRQRLGFRIDVTTRVVNADPEGRGGGRWDRLTAMIERPETLEGLYQFALADQMLMHRLGLGPQPIPHPGCRD